MKTLFISLFLVSTSSVVLRAQPTISAVANPVNAPAAAPKELVTGYGYLEHLINETRTYRWTRTVVNLQGDSTCLTAVADNALEYPPFVSSHTFDLQPYETNAGLFVHLLNFGGSVPCCGLVHLRVEEEADSTNMITVVYLFGDCVTGVSGLPAGSIRVFPNPVQEVFSLTNAEKFHRVKLLSLDGKLLRTFPADLPVFPVGGLPSGTYLVLLEDREGRPGAVLEFVKSR